MKRFRKKNIDITNGDIKKTLIALATPIIISMGLQTAFNIIDAIFVGRLGADALAAISLTFPVIFFIISIGIGISIGVTSLIARYVGAKKITAARQTATHGIILSAIISIISTLIGLHYIEQIFTIMGATAAVILLAEQYMTIIIYSFTLIFAVFILNSILNGEGDTITPMNALIMSVILNIILDPILIFGWGIIPAMGIKGAAIATIISRSLGLIYLLYHFTTKKAAITPVIRGFNYQTSIIKNILKVGIPSSISQTSISLYYFIITTFIARFGSEAIAAFGAASRLNTIGILPGIAVATAVITMAGQNAGTGRFDRVEKTTQTATKMLAYFMAAVTLTLFTFPKYFMMLFTTDKEVLEIGITFLKIVPLELIFVSIIMIIGATFQGVGKGSPQLILTLIRLFIFATPIAYYLAFIKGIGITGIWWSFPIAAALTSIISIIWFSTGSWKKTPKI